MKAAVYYETGAPEVLRYEDVPDPVASPGSVLIEVEAISVEGGDTLNRAGGEMATNPHIVGYQCAGTILEVGEGVTDRFVGQRVVATGLWGSHAAMIAAPSVITWEIPEGADLVKCACVPVAFGTADDCLFEFGHLRSGETVLIQAGAGGVGVAAIQLANRAGATVIATASSLDRLEPLKALGLDHAVDYSQSGWVDAVREITGGRGVELVVDSVGGKVLAGSAQCLAYRGRLVTVGNAGRDPQPFDLSLLSAGNQSVTSVFLGAEILNPRTYAMIAGLVDDVAAGRLEVIVDRLFPLSEAADAHAYIESRQAVGRVVLIP
ncbi:MAG: Alcohol dehydrogenase zinc-binding domain protein [Actinomycetia bacterium]|jgi:NADPH2:quinone reductase|nr:Alcohol dehydrogenase zinc-binding domain protein [Actinomycetes bacterium]MDQ1461145.1 NADPH:quinone reductase [Actinomycetota bacterium]